MRGSTSVGGDEWTPSVRRLHEVEQGGRVEPFWRRGHEKHYVRKAHSRHAHTKNEDAQITRLRHRVSHYRGIKDA
jgi:hypothetical protein